MQGNRFIDSVESSLDTLSKLGEQPVRSLGDASLYSDILAMNATLQNISDDEILNMQEVNAKKVLTTMKIYGKYGLCIVLGCVHANGFSFEPAYDVCEMFNMSIAWSQVSHVYNKC